MQVHTEACAGDFVHLLLDGEEVTAAPPMPVDSGAASVKATLTVGPSHHWLRVEVRDSKGELLLVSSPLYINFPR